MTIILFTVPGHPVGKARPRFTRSGHAYTPEKTASFENLVKLAAKNAMRDLAPIEGSVSAEVISSFPVPASWSKKKRQAALNGEVMPTVKPDADNVAKAVLDAINGICYADDSQVVTLHIEKRYSATPLTVVRITDD
ncbi:MAG: RusA family crossover junction endodeoxyribonuclease [Azoarcus sp.]|jgi:Holliday junction resolvase RusA-like endonuclease|nr:RusA family crossover junction endodeoxyribonuclease [Azoarcus sp.]